MKITIETPPDQDQESMATILEEVAAALRNDEDISDREQMDGSIRIETTHGVVFLTHEQ